MIYKFLKQLIKLALFFFFRKIIVAGKEFIPTEGPIILVANHPNTLMDPLLIATLTNQRIGFVANAGIFINKFISSILSYFHVIPIFRKQDVEAGEKLDNKTSFAKCHEYLQNKGSLLIFPEGTSHYELKLREIKTGTARIALSYEEIKSFKGGLKIVPIALDYSDAIQFRSIVSVTVCPAIDVDSYKEFYAKDEVTAVTELTEAIRKELAAIIPQTSNKEQEKFLVQAHQFYSLYNLSNTDQEFHSDQLLELRNQVSKALRFIYANNSQLYSKMKRQLSHYYELLKNEKLSPQAIPTEEFKQSSYIIDILKFILLFPVYVIGLVCNYLPYMLVAKIFKRLKLEIEYRAPVQMMLGMFIFPLYYALIFWAFKAKVSDDIWLLMGLLVIMPLSGYGCLFFYNRFRRFIEQLRFDITLQTNKKKTILTLRQEIVAAMNQARTIYLEKEKI